MKYSLTCTALTLERHLQMWVAFYTYANTVIVRGVGGALLTIADHKVLAIHVGIVFTHYKTKQRTKIVKIQSHQPYVLQGYFEVEDTAFCCPLLKALYENQEQCNNKKIPKLMSDLRSHLMAALSSSRLRHTSQNLRLKMEGVEKQWATGFLIRVVAMLEQADTTNFRHRSWTTKLQTVQKKRRILTDAINFI